MVKVSIERAVSVVSRSYPGCEVRVMFPIDPEVFFVREPAPRAATVGADRPGLTAA